jgi:hypothetical protein
MKITKITRLVSDSHYGNLSMSADLEGNENPIESAIELSFKVETALREIESRKNGIKKEHDELSGVRRRLQGALNLVEQEINEIPF